MRPYLICASPRTGSNLLATALRSTGVAGHPYSYFNVQTMNEAFMLKALGLAPGEAPDLAGRLHAIIRAGTSRNGVFGATVHGFVLRDLLAAVAAHGHPPNAEGLEALWPDLGYVWLRRENKVAQAISRYLARTTGRYQELDGDDAALEPPSSARFDYDAISRFEALNQREEHFWRGFLAGRDDATLMLTYEDLAAGYEATVTRVLSFIGLDAASVTIPRPAFRRQADARSQDWERRYREMPAHNL